MSNLILNKSKFIHIPKCGGTAIQGALYYINPPVVARFHSPNYGHLFLHQMPDDDRIPFAFVRHPYTWWESFFYWNKRDDGRFNRPEQMVDSFEQWIIDYGPLWLGLYTTWINRYIGIDALYPVKNKISLDNIGRMENLYLDLKRILDNIGERYNPERLNGIINGEVPSVIDKNIQNYNKSALSKHAKEIIYNAEKETFERFDYCR